MDNLKLHPYHLQGYVMLLQLLDENVIYADESALALMERGLTLFPYETSLWRMAGEIYQKLGDTEYAKNTYKRGLTVDTLDRELLQRLDALYPRGRRSPPSSRRPAGCSATRKRPASLTKCPPITSTACAPTWKRI